MLPIALLAMSLAVPAPQPVFVAGKTLYVKWRATPAPQPYTRVNDELCVTAPTDVPPQRVYVARLDGKAVTVTCELRQVVHIIGDGDSYLDTQACLCTGQQDTCGPYAMLSCPAQLGPIAASKTLAGAPYLAWIGAPQRPVVTAGIPDARAARKPDTALLQPMRGHALYRSQSRKLLTEKASDDEQTYRIAEKPGARMTWQIGAQQISTQSLYLYAVPTTARAPELRTDQTPWAHSMVLGVFDTTSSPPTLLLVQELLWNYIEQGKVIAVGSLEDRGIVVLTDERRLEHASSAYLTRHAVLKTMDGRVLFDAPYAIFSLEDRD